MKTGTSNVLVSIYQVTSHSLLFIFVPSSSWLVQDEDQAEAPATWRHMRNVTHQWSRIAQSEIQTYDNALVLCVDDNRCSSLRLQLTNGSQATAYDVTRSMNTKERFAAFFLQQTSRDTWRGRGMPGWRHDAISWRWDGDNPCHIINELFQLDLKMWKEKKKAFSFLEEVLLGIYFYLSHCKCTGKSKWLSLGKTH